MNGESMKEDLEARMVEYEDVVQKAIMSREPLDDQTKETIHKLISDTEMHNNNSYSLKVKQLVVNLIHSEPGLSLLESKIDEIDPKNYKLFVLRSGITKLDRLKGTVHTIYAGRILIFLARFVPFFDPSGTNVKADFNFRPLPATVRKNLARISQKEEELLFQRAEVDMEEGETISDDEESDDSYQSTKQSDFDKIYSRFWKTQEFLGKPNSLFDKNNWHEFRTLVNTLISYFVQNLCNFKIWKLHQSYMTEPKSFGLQLQDINMRRCFLLQLLMVFRYLEQYVDTRLEGPKLDKIQVDWLVTATKNISDLLQVTPHNEEGKDFASFAGHVLRSETSWVNWKQNNRCAESKRPVEDEDEIINMGVTYFKRRKLSDEMKQAKPYNMHVIGSQEMSKLWNQRHTNLHKTPNLAKHFNVPPEKQLEQFKDPNTSFRILRLLRKSPHFFVPTAAVIQSLDGYLKALADKHFNVATTPNTI